MPIKPPSDEARRLSQAAANRLHHLSLRYVGALVEAAQGKPVGLLPKDHPGLKEMRDLIDLVLLTRAEINALTHCLAHAGLLDMDRFARQASEEYDWFSREKAKFLKVGVFDGGLTFGEGGV